MDLSLIFEPVLRNKTLQVGLGCTESFPGRLNAYTYGILIALSIEHNVLESFVNDRLWLFELALAVYIWRIYV